jgi:hypothetical protein
MPMAKMGYRDAQIQPMVNWLKEMGKFSQW